jgi:hypothetical protein
MIPASGMTHRAISLDFMVMEVKLLLEVVQGVVLQVVGVF